MSSTRIHAWLAVNGVEVRVRFDDDAEFDRFVEKCNGRMTGLLPMFLKNGQRILVRPSSVDAISRDGDR